MSDKDVSQKQVEELIKELGADAVATITMGQLQHLVNEKNSAEERIKELEARLIRKNELLREAKRLAENHKEHLHRIDKLKFHGM